MKKLLSLLMLTLVLALPVCAQALDIGTLSPAGMPAAYD